MWIVHWLLEPEVTPENGEERAENTLSTALWIVLGGGGGFDGSPVAPPPGPASSTLARWWWEAPLV